MPEPCAIAAIRSELPGKTCPRASPKSNFSVGILRLEGSERTFAATYDAAHPQEVPRDGTYPRPARRSSAAKIVRLRTEKAFLRDLLCCPSVLRVRSWWFYRTGISSSATQYCTDCRLNPERISPIPNTPRRRSGKFSAIHSTHGIRNVATAVAIPMERPTSKANPTKIVRCESAPQTRLVITYPT